MPRQRSPSRDKAKELYINNKGNKPLKDIAAELNVLDTQIRKWKFQDKWDEELKGNVTKPKRNVTKQNKGIEEQFNIELLPEEIETLANEDLTEKQRLFCLYYTKWFNATKAYQKAYNCDYNTAMVRGCESLRNVKIKEHIQAIKDAKIKRSMYNIEDLFQKMIAIGYADITDFMEFGQEDAETVNGEFIKVNRVRFKDSSEVDGTLIQEVKQGKDGVSIKLISKEFALKWLEKNYGTASDETKARIDLLKAQTSKLQKGDDIPNDGAQESMDAVSGIIAQMQPLGDDEV